MWLELSGIILSCTLLISEVNTNYSLMVFNLCYKFDSWSGSSHFNLNNNIQLLCSLPWILIIITNMAVFFYFSKEKRGSCGFIILKIFEKPYKIYTQHKVLGNFGGKTLSYFCFRPKGELKRSKCSFVYYMNTFYYTDRTRVR